MADPWCFFSALSVWRSSSSRRRALAESPWVKTSPVIHKRYVFARAERPERPTFRMIRPEAA